MLQKHISTWYDEHSQQVKDLAKDPSVIIPWRKNLDEQLAKEGNIKPIFPQRKDTDKQ